MSTREWKQCPECDPRNFFPLYPREEEDLLEPCPACGQPPRCGVACQTDHHCPRVATIALNGSLIMCEAHYYEHEFAAEQEDSQQAMEFLDHFLGVAESVGCDALIDLLEMAQAGAQSQIDACKAHREAL